VKQGDSTSATAIKFIEFMGLPGSGKSTIAALLESDLRRLGIETVSRSVDHAPFVRRHWERLLRIIRNAGRCRRTYLDALRLILASGQKSPLDFAKVTWNSWHVIALIADCRAAGDAVTIIDQGLFQAIWSIRLSSSRELSAEACNALLRSADVTDVLVVNISSEIGVASRRLVTRTFKGTRLSSQAGGSYAEHWQAAAASLADLMQLAHIILPHDPSGERIITIENNTACPRTAASEVASAFLARARPDAPAECRELCWDI
jgi:hypothetical protein